MDDIWKLSAQELRTAYRDRTLSPLEVVDGVARRIERLNPLVSAFTTLTLDQAVEEASRRTDQLARGDVVGPLHGVPVGIKELFDVGGARTTFGSAIFQGRVPREDAAAVSRLRAAGAVVVGLTRSHEFGWGITTQHAVLGGTRNPWDLTRVPGGSSGGSAAAVALGMVPVALGSDTGGSIRIPASYCGVAGLKPTYGRISKRGAIPLAPSLDHPGPIARDVRDLATTYSILAGFDPQDPSTVPGLHDLSVTVEGESSVDHIRFALAPDLHVTPLLPDYSRIFAGIGSMLSGSGVELREVEIGGVDEIRPVFSVVQMAEAYDVHSRVLAIYPQRRFEYGDDVRRRLELASEVGLSDYLQARERMAAIRRRFELIFEHVDVLLTPVAAGGPSTIAEPDIAPYGPGARPFRDLVMGYTVPQDVAGLPVCSIRAGFDDHGIPVGVQATAGPGREDLVLRAARFLQQSLHAVSDLWPAIA